MSSIQIVSTLMVSSSVITDIVTSAGIYPIEAPQKEAKPPFYVLNIVGGRDDQLLSGAARYYEGRVRVECLAEKGAQAVQMGNKALSVLENIIKADVDDFTDVDVSFADTDLTDSGNVHELFRRILDFKVRYRNRS